MVLKMNKFKTFGIHLSKFSILSELIIFFVYFQIWQSVKGTSPNMSACEIGATIGRMWRELADYQKQKFKEEFIQDKVL